jgi:uncharacterized membrane protein YeiH
MHAATLRIGNERATRFQPVSVSPRKKERAQLITEEISGEPVSVLSTDFSGVTAQIVQPKVSVMHQLRLYAGAALIGAIACGIVYGSSPNREVAQIVGAVLAAGFFFALEQRHRR